MKLNKHPDRTTYINQTKLGKQIFRINSYQDIWHLKQFIDAFHSETVSEAFPEGMRPNIIIPNLIDAQADRRFNKGESFGLKLVLQELASLDANFEIFHPHNPEVVEMGFEVLNKKVKIIDNSQFILQVLENIVDEDDNINSWEDLYQNIILMSSDAGGFKPLMKLCKQLQWKGEVFSASKSRDGETGQLTQLIDREDFEGKDILIVDDLLIGGATLIGLGKLLKDRNIGKLYAAISHTTIQSPREELTDIFDRIFTTNSKFEQEDYTLDKNKFEVIQLF